MTRILILLLTVLFLGCKVNNNSQSLKNNNTSFFVGTYTKEESKGIYKYSISDEGKLSKIGLVAVTKNPSF